MFLSSWLRSLKQHSTSPRPRRRGASRHFHENGSPAIAQVEKLEERTLLSGVYSSGDLDLAIPDQGQVTSAIVVPDSISIADVNVTVNIDHTRDQDLDVFLIAPDGTRVELFTDVGGNGDNFVGTTLDDEASGSIVDGSAPFTGSFRPEGSLSALDGKDSVGTWSLEITDDKRRETGTLNSWSITVEHSVAAAALAAGSSAAESTSAGTFPTFESFSTTDSNSLVSSTSNDDPIVQVELVQPITLSIDDNTGADLPNDDILTDEEPAIDTAAIDDLFANFDELLLDDLLAV